MVIRANGEVLPWRRDAIEVHAFHIEVPAGVDAIKASFQFLSATTPSQGAVAMTPVMVVVHWPSMVLYPAGHYTSRIEVEASLVLPDGWSFATALTATTDGPVVEFETVPLDTLIDSPVLAGQHVRKAALDDEGAVTLNLIADSEEALQATDEQLAPHRALVAEVDALFARRPFERYAFLTALSDRLGGGGVEHRASAEIVLPTSYFTAWDANAPRRDVFAHEFVHAWNGKSRRGEDSWTTSFEQPIRNSLMWVYEGQTQYWGEVLAVRSGLWSAQQALDTLARTAALYSTRPGGAWRPMSDTTRDPIIASRQPLPWPSWQRSEDYYSEGQLLWLEIDTRLREMSGDAHSLDDFARRFFNAPSRPLVEPSLYRFEDVVEALNDIAPFDWAALINERLETREVGAPLGGLERGGYRLVYRGEPSDFAAATDAMNKVLNLRFSIGVAVGEGGELQEVVWDSPAFEADLVAGAKLLAVNGSAYEPQSLKAAIAGAQKGGAIDLLVEHHGRLRTASIAYSEGLKFPHLERMDGLRPRLLEIFSSRRSG